MKRFNIKTILAALVVIALMLSASAVFGQAYDTEGYNRGKNMTFRDKTYSPQRGVSVWEFSPQLALLDPVTGFSVYYEFADGDTAFLSWATENHDGVAATFTITDTTGGGWLTIAPASQDSAAASLCSLTEPFKLSADKPLLYEARVSLTEATQSEMVVGLLLTTTNAIASKTDGIYFFKNDGDANIDYASMKNSTTTLSTGDTGSDMVSNTMVRLGIRWDGDATAYFYINGVQTNSVTANIPNDEFLAPVFSVEDGDGSGVKLYVDYMKATQIR